MKLNWDFLLHLSGYLSGIVVVFDVGGVRIVHIVSYLKVPVCAGAYGRQWSAQFSSLIRICTICDTL